MTAILHDRLPVAPWADPRLRRLPGILPLDPEDWLRTDETFAEQMALRDRLIAERRADVLRVAESAYPAASELLSLVTKRLAQTPGYRVGAEITRPDDVSVPIDTENPLVTLGRVVQCDLCLLEKHGPEYILTGAVLCFPASWSLEEKFLRPLTGIHAPVRAYDDDLARRVARLFDGIRPGRPLWRANALYYDDPTLFQPRTETHRRPIPGETPRYIRSERQCLLRLPETGAVVFSIHTYLIDRASLTPDQAAALLEHPLPRVPEVTGTREEA